MGILHKNNVGNRVAWQENGMLGSGNVRIPRGRLGGRGGV